jgi:hypothetical protein
LAVERKSLGRIGDVIGDGGEATVYELLDLRLPEPVEALVYKEYHPSSVSRVGLWRLVEKRLALDESKRHRLDEIAAWPYRVVVDKGDIVGVILPRIAPSYFEPVILLGTGKTEVTPNSVLNLFVQNSLLRRLGRAVPTDEQRLWLCREFARALAFYHDELEVAFGDISPNNELYRIHPEPSIVFIDCDGVRPVGEAGAQCNTPDWIPPEGDVLSVSSDRYKLGLFILRCLSPGEGGSVLVDPARIGIRLDTVGSTMLTRALDRDERRRPSAHDWYVHLSRLLGHPVDPPKLSHVRLDEKSVLRGRPCTLSWKATDAISIEVRFGTQVLTIDGRAGGGILPISLTETGFVHVRAVNDAGSDQKTLGPVAVVVPPEQKPIPVAIPDMPWLGADVPPMPGIPAVPLPAWPEAPMPDRLTTVPGAGAMRWPDVPAVPCPIDIVELMTGGPLLDPDLLFKGPR